MKAKIRILSLILAAAMACASLASCGGGSTTEVTDSKETGGTEASTSAPDES